MIIVSMAIIASRVCNIPAILKNLARQSRPPDKVLLHFSNEPWHHDDGISNLRLPASPLDVEAVCVPNTGSSRKYLFAAERYRRTKASILLLDDDLTWERGLIENLHDHQNAYRRVVGTRGWSQFQIVEDQLSGEMIFQRPNAVTVIGKNIYKPAEVIVTSSGWATMFYAEDVNCRMFDSGLQKAVSLGYSDEVFLSAMIPYRKFVIPMSKGFYRKLKTPTALFRDPHTARAKALQAQLLGDDVIRRAAAYLEVSDAVLA